ncbi:hypothetical protein JAAARDRAFT_663321 [Jaapia argillacea MUCL 33604]|uniref:Uncharacterized protein n=1 Tax=Jaapia argillacea MUCL 33604 TaxID=933084 RepID=A0A067PFE2_9AGAM|nr:hypothetical protein JAAARDRAFT_663321 [Jaapia argillacea MUCL 33604]
MEDGLRRRPNLKSHPLTTVALHPPSTCHQTPRIPSPETSSPSCTILMHPPAIHPQPSSLSVH